MTICWRVGAVAIAAFSNGNRTEWPRSRKRRRDKRPLAEQPCPARPDCALSQANRRAGGTRVAGILLSSWSLLRFLGVACRVSAAMRRLSSTSQRRLGGTPNAERKALRAGGSGEGRSTTRPRRQRRCKRVRGRRHRGALHGSPSWKGNSSIDGRRTSGFSGCACGPGGLTQRDVALARLAHGCA